MVRRSAMLASALLTVFGASAAHAQTAPSRNCTPNIPGVPGIGVDVPGGTLAVRTFGSIVHQSAPVILGCLGGNQATIVGRLGNRLIESIAVNRGDTVWATGQANATRLDDGTFRDEGGGVTGAVGIDTRFGARRELLAGVGVGAMRARLTGSTVAALGTPRVDVDGVGPIGYLSYSPTPSGRSQWMFSTTAAYMFLDSDTRIVSLPTSLVPSRNGGRGFFLDVSAQYGTPIAANSNSFIGGLVAFRLADSRFDEPVFVDRTDTSAIARITSLFEVGPRTGLIANAGVIVPLSDLTIGSGIAGAGFRRPDVIGELQLGIEHRFSDLFSMTLQGYGASGSGLRELGGFLSLRYAYDRRDQRGVQ